MPVMTPHQFIAIADRIAATYDLLLRVEQGVSAPVPNASYQSGQAYPARLLVDLTKNNAHVLLQAKNTGTLGNTVFFSIINPGVINSPLQSRSVGSHLVISLATDSSGQLISLTEEIIHLLTTHSDFSGRVNVFYPVTGTGGWVQPLAMTALAGGVGNGSLSYTQWSIVTTRPGFEGNNYTLTINQPTTPLSSFSAFWNLRQLIINLPTNGSGSAIETWDQFKVDLAGVTSDFFISVGDGSALVPALATVNFSGGGTGSYAQVVLTPPAGSRTDSADPDVASTLLKTAIDADTNITASQLEQNLSYLSNLMGSLIQHFITSRYPGGMAGFLTDNNILVHKNFSLINNNRSGQTLNAANVFRPDQIVLGTVVLGGSGVTLTPGIPLGSGSGVQSEINYGPQRLSAVLVPQGGTLASNWSFTVNLIDSTGVARISDPITFTAGDVTGSYSFITNNTNALKFYSVTAATQVSGGTSGDKVFITQVIERQISL